MKSLRLILWILFSGNLFCMVSSCNKTSVISVPDSPYPISLDNFTTDTLTSGLVIPFGIGILGKEDYLISDRIGKIFRFKNSSLKEIKGAPEVLTFDDPGLPMIIHGGLMDLSLHPQYPEVPWVYIAYFAPDSKAKVARFQLIDNEVRLMEVIFSSSTEGYYGNGMRIVWQDDTHFFLNIGSSAFTTLANPILVPQDLNEDWGKIHRLNQDGSIPSDNPIIDENIGISSIYSYGHRDVQGLVFDKETQTLYGIEHGPKGGDELNIITPGGNYGWPIFTYGIHYDGQKISSVSEDSAKEISILPEHYWTVPTNDGGQAIAPSSAILVEKSNFPEWNGHFLIPSLAFRRLLKYNPKTKETFGLYLEGRIRDLVQEEDGNILLLVERNNLNTENGMLIRVRKP